MYQDEILKDLFFIERGYLNSNHFVYRSKSPVLIDTGYIADFNETAGVINDLGISLSDVTLIINTHTHCDHIGGNKAIQEASGCDIALHKVGKYFIDSRDDWSTWWRYYSQEADFFNCTQSLEDGQMIIVGPYEFQVIYTPGHASDGIVLYNRKEKILISSDTLWENDMAVITIRVEGSRALFDMQESLEKIESLDVKMVYPGHGRPFSNIKEAISKSEEKLEGYFHHPEEIGDDLIKKIMIYTLLMKRAIGENALFPYLMGTYWFKETIDLYFNGEYELKYNEIIRTFNKRGIIRRKNGNLFTIVKP
jgi:hydroxyacylglutathione hydrolase